MKNRMSIWFDPDPIFHGQIRACWGLHSATGPTLAAALMTLTIYLETKGMLVPAEQIVRGPMHNEL